MALLDYGVPVTLFDTKAAGSNTSAGSTLCRWVSTPLSLGLTLRRWVVIRDSQGFSYPGGLRVGYGRVRVWISILVPPPNPYPEDRLAGFPRVSQYGLHKKIPPLMRLVSTIQYQKNWLKSQPGTKSIPN